jgi:radical SAM superfamily enzyme YgiQ (UPF0313 family)
MDRAGPGLLLINPWIYDFAAHNVYASPLGLLRLAALLERRGFHLHLVDCLEPVAALRSRRGTGRYPKEILPTPPALRGVPRRFGRYGASESQVRARLARVPPPAAILVTSLMTYWYPGVAAAIALAREYFPGSPVLLGGIYATLCPEHARQSSGADVIITGPGEEAVFQALAALGISPAAVGERPEPDPVYAALHLLPGLSFIPVLTSRGCPFACAYCASRRLAPGWQPRPPLAVAAELAYWHRRLGLTEAAFYDDALLFKAEDHLLPILEEVVRRGLALRFHTPNALHARFLTREVACWLKRAGFVNPRLGVETTALGPGRLDAKLAEGELEEALANLKMAGFTSRDLGVYLLMGLPGQEDEEVAASVRRIHVLGARPILAQYAPIPGTHLWPRAVAASRFDLPADPLFHNNSIFPCWPEFSWERFARLKRLAQGG